MRNEGGRMADPRICWRCGKEPRDSVEPLFWLTDETESFKQRGEICVACQTEEEMAGVRAALAEIQAEYRHDR